MNERMQLLISHFKVFEVVPNWSRFYERLDQTAVIAGLKSERSVGTT